MYAGGLKKTPSNKPKDTDIHLCKKYSKAYRNNRPVIELGPLDVRFAIDVDVKRRQN
jgi:hypothetical protein